MHKDDSKKWDSIVTRITAVSNYEKYTNKITFNSVGDGMFEFKRPGLRLYAFYDEFGDEHQLILCTNGGTKNNKREQQSDIKRAKKIKASYLAVKEDPNTEITLQESTLKLRL